MPFDRRHLLTTGLGLGLTATAAGAQTARPAADREPATGRSAPASAFGIEPNAARDQTAALQKAIDETAARGVMLALPPGLMRAGGLVLRPGTRISGVAGASVLQGPGGKPIMSAAKAALIQLDGIVFDGATLPLQDGVNGALLALTGVERLSLSEIVVRKSAAHGVKLERCGGRVATSEIIDCAQAGLFSRDATGLEIVHNRIADCANNGILVWRTTNGEDGTIVAMNRIEKIAAKAGGTGQNGNGINVYRAANVIVTANRIADCAYSAIRGNAASNIQMTSNSASRIGEVALYAEFGFEGAVIANNVVDSAASGVSVTNFNEGGRLAIVQGNLIRNITRREHEPEDKRGEGIGVEADTIVTGNVIEGAATVGIHIGWGKYMREVVATGNLIRSSRVGITVSGDPGAGACLLAQNMISGATAGAIVAMNQRTPLSGDLIRDTRGKPPGLTLSGNVGV